MVFSDNPGPCDEMIKGIGTDIVSTARIAEALQNFGERFAQRILCDNEMERFQSLDNATNYLAKRFAAKEAVAKAMGTGIGKISWQDIEIANDPQGAPLIIPSQALQRQMETNGVKCLHVSISDEHNFAVAFVIAED